VATFLASAFHYAVVLVEKMSGSFLNAFRICSESVTKPIEAAFARVQAAFPEHRDKPSSLRSCVEAPPGWVTIDMDLKTAEVVALAHYANDRNLIRVLTERDVQFARISPAKRATSRQP
jgi:hypothetical protein